MIPIDERPGRGVEVVLLRERKDVLAPGQVLARAIDGLENGGGDEPEGEAAAGALRVEGDGGGQADQDIRDEAEGGSGGLGGGDAPGDGRGGSPGRLGERRPDTARRG